MRKEKKEKKWALRKKVTESEKALDG